MHVFLSNTKEWNSEKCKPNRPFLPTYLVNYPKGPVRFTITGFNFSFLSSNGDRIVTKQFLIKAFFVFLKLE